MKLEILDEKEYINFIEKSPLNNFYQLPAWGELKKKNGWDMYLVGIKNENKVIAATLLLSKNMPIIRKKMFYAPRGFLLDYNDYELLKEFTKCMKNFVSEKNGIFVKMDPYLIRQERDCHGEVKENGIDNRNVIDNLKKLKYQHYGYNLYYETLQPRWLYRLNIRDRTAEEIFKEMKPNTRNLINRSINNGISVRKIDINELDKFTNIMVHTSKRRGFIDRPFEYYKNMYETLNKDKLIEIYIAEMSIDSIIEKIKDSLELEKNEEKKEELKLKQKELLETKKQGENKVVLAGGMFLLNKNEFVYLLGGGYNEYMKYYPQYLIQWKVIQEAINYHCNYYNFYGITGVFDKKDPLYGLYLFKRGFGGEVVELIGEFDLIINRFYYYLYKISFKIYNGIKHLKIKLNRG